MHVFHFLQRFIKKLRKLEKAKKKYITQWPLT